MRKPITTMEALREHFPEWTRVCKGARRGTVTDVGLLRGYGVVYVSWDQYVPDATSPFEAVVASQLRQVTP